MIKKKHRNLFFKKSYTISEDNIRKFSEVSGDNNPIHIDDDFAKTTMFGGRICHGMLIGSYISAIIGTEFPGAGTIYLSQTLTFKKPVRIGDTITITVSYVDNVKKNWIKLETRVFDQNNELVIEGYAIVIPPDSFFKLLKEP